MPPVIFALSPDLLNCYILSACLAITVVSMLRNRHAQILLANIVIMLSVRARRTTLVKEFLFVVHDGTRLRRPLAWPTRNREAPSCRTKATQRHESWMQPRGESVVQRERAAATSCMSG